MSAGKQMRMAQARYAALDAFRQARTREERMAAVRQYADAYNLDVAETWAEFQREGW